MPNTNLAVKSTNFGGTAHNFDWVKCFCIARSRPIVIIAVESTFVWNVTQRTSVVVTVAAEVDVTDFRQQLLPLPLLLASTSHIKHLKGHNLKKQRVGLYGVLQKMSPYYFLSNSLKSEPICIIFVHKILNKFVVNSVAFVHLTPLNV